jgi:small-conductance mechanosensitive channel
MAFPFADIPEFSSQLTGRGPAEDIISIIKYVYIRYIGSALAENIWYFISTIISISIIIISTILIARLVNGLLEKQIPKIMESSRLGKEFDETSHAMTRRLIVAAIYSIGILMTILLIPSLNRIAIAMLAGAGVATLAIGFAAQDSLSNIISGIFLAIFKPMRIGDYVDFKGEYGHIEDITLRHTIICTWDERRVIVPNKIMGSDSIVNWSINNPEIIWPVNFGIGYSSDIDKARSIIIEEAKRHPHVLKGKEISVRLTELGDFAVNLRLTFYVPSRGVSYETGCEIREAVKKRFDAEGIEIPYPYRNLVFMRQPDEASSCPGPENAHSQEEEQAN